MGRTSTQFSFILSFLLLIHNSGLISGPQIWFRLVTKLRIISTLKETKCGGNLRTTAGSWLALPLNYTRLPIILSIPLAFNLISLIICMYLTLAIEYASFMVTNMTTNTQYPQYLIYREHVRQDKVRSGLD